MNRYSSLGARWSLPREKSSLASSQFALRPVFTFAYNYFFRLGFLDGHEGLLLHIYHAIYVSWKYAEGVGLSRNQSNMSS